MGFIFNVNKKLGAGPDVVNGSLDDPAVRAAKLKGLYELCSNIMSTRGTSIAKIFALLKKMVADKKHIVGVGVVDS